MNLVLFEPAELAAPLPLSDPRAQHILKVLRRAPGDTFVAGLVDGPLGAATLRSVDATSVSLDFAPTHQPPPLPPVALLVGLPRPQTARDLLRDATTLGVACIHFIATERADPNYATSSLWTSGEWRRHLLAGAAQACDTHLPAVTWTHSLESILPELCHPYGYTTRGGLHHSSTPLPLFPSSAPRQARADQPSPPTPHPRLLALDNYEATVSLATALASGPSLPGPQASPFPPSLPCPLVLALGPERGWGPADRSALRASGFTLCSLGARVLRLETAVTAALALAHFSTMT